jgi:hypothetical protein
MCPVTNLRLPLGLCVVTSLFLLVACSQSPQPSLPDEPAPKVLSTGPGFFEDRTGDSGVNFTYRNGEEAGHYAILESLGGGVALIDYDGDGLLDLFVTGGGYFDGPDKKQIKGHPCKLYKNLGGFQFKDVTAEVFRQQPGFYTHGCAVGDFDNDGWPDLLVTGYGRVALYRNNRGVFEDVTARAGLLDKRPVHWSTSAAWTDFNGDGLPDLFIAHYVDWSFQNHPRCRGYKLGQEVDVCPPEVFKPMPSDLYLNNGDGRFTLAAGAGILPGKGLGVVAVDIDGDGKPDLYVANDGIGNYLYVNQGGGKFKDVGRTSGVALDAGGRPNGSMGVDAADYDGSGRFSLFVANYENENHCLYRNLGKLQFHEASRGSGVAAIGLSFVGFGAGFVDFDRDGAEDLFISNGHVVRYPAAGGREQRPVLLRNLRKPGGPFEKVRFEDVSAAGGPYFRGLYLGRGAAFGDLDNDGRVDIVISHVNAPVSLLRNTVANGNHWLGVTLEGRLNRDAVGARLTLEVGGQKLVRAIKGGGSYLSASDRRVVFGLGAVGRAARLTVHWPWGREQTWDGDALGVDRYVLLREGEAQPLPWPRGPK